MQTITQQKEHMGEVIDLVFCAFWMVFLFRTVSWLERLFICLVLIGMLYKNRLATVFTCVKHVCYYTISF